MLRRDFIAGQTALITTASTACTNDDLGPPPVDSTPKKKVAPAKPPTPTPAAVDPHAGHDMASHGDGGVIEAAGKCIAAGQVCLQHCIVLLAGGDTTMGDCARSTADMVAVSQAAQALAAGDSPQLKAQVAVALASVNRCAEACKDACEAAAKEYGRLG